MIEEVIVTATYRETNLMDTAQSISAVTDSLIQDVGGQSMEDIYTMVPGLSMQGSLDGENRFTVRGVTSQTGGTGYFLTGATIGVYLDGTPVTAALGPDNQVSGTLFDIERVEVLKGPQGTLFGEGSQGGTIRYLYKQPDPTQFDAAVNVGYSNMGASKKNSRRIDGMVNIPFGDGFALRLTGWDATTAGYVDNLSLEGEVLDEDFNPAARTGVRAALRYEADRFSVAGTIYNSKQETRGSGQTVRPYEVSTPSIPRLLTRVQGRHRHLQRGRGNRLRLGELPVDDVLHRSPNPLDRIRYVRRVLRVGLRLRRVDACGRPPGLHTGAVLRLLSGMARILQHRGTRFRHPGR